MAASSTTNGDMASFNCVRQAVQTLVFSDAASDAQAFSIAAIDSNRDGELSVKEKQEAVKHAYQRLLKDCSLVGQNGKGLSL